MKDMLGQDINIGDTVFFGKGGRYGYCATGHVRRMTEHQIEIQIFKSERYLDGSNKVTKLTDNGQHTITSCVVITSLNAAKLCEMNSKLAV